MARKVYRYGPLEITQGPQQVSMPIGATIARIGSKATGFVDIWAIIDEDVTENAVRTFQIFATGQPLPEDAQYMDTTIQDTALTGTTVWHLFERMAD